MALRILSVERETTERTLSLRTCSRPRRSRPYPEPLPYFLVHRNVFAGFDGNRQSVPDRLIECPALFAAEYVKTQMAVIDEWDSLIAFIVDVKQ